MLNLGIYKSGLDLKSNSYFLKQKSFRTNLSIVIITYITSVKFFLPDINDVIEAVKIRIKTF